MITKDTKDGLPPDDEVDCLRPHEAAHLRHEYARSCSPFAARDRRRAKTGIFAEDEVIRIIAQHLGHYFVRTQQ